MGKTRYTHWRNALQGDIPTSRQADRLSQSVSRNTRQCTNIRDIFWNSVYIFIYVYSYFFIPLNQTLPFPSHVRKFVLTPLNQSFRMLVSRIKCFENRHPECLRDSRVFKTGDGGQFHQSLKSPVNDTTFRWTDICWYLTFVPMFRADGWKLAIVRNTNHIFLRPVIKTRKINSTR